MSYSDRELRSSFFMLTLLFSFEHLQSFRQTNPIFFLFQYSYEHFYGRASLGQVVNIVDDRMVGTPGPSGNLASAGNPNSRNTGMGPVGPGVQVESVKIANVLVLKQQYNILENEVTDLIRY